MIPGYLAALLVFGIPTVFMAGYLAALDEDEEAANVPKPEPQIDTSLD